MIKKIVFPLTIMLALSACTAKTEQDTNSDVPTSYATGDLASQPSTQFLATEQGLLFISGKDGGFTATVLSDSAVVLDWPDRDNVVQYVVSRRFVASDIYNDVVCVSDDAVQVSEFVDIDIVNNSTYTDRTAQDDLRYDYRIVSVNETGAESVSHSGLSVSINEAHQIIDSVEQSTVATSPTVLTLPQGQNNSNPIYGSTGLSVAVAQAEVELEETQSVAEQHSQQALTAMETSLIAGEAASKEMSEVVEVEIAAAQAAVEQEAAEEQVAVLEAAVDNAVEESTAAEKEAAELAVAEKAAEAQAAAELAEAAAQKAAEQQAAAEQAEAEKLAAEIAALEAQELAEISTAAEIQATKELELARAEAELAQQEACQVAAQTQVDLAAANLLETNEGGSVLAFPGAVGFGRFATGGRQGKVVIVNTRENTINPNDGKTSLREALQEEKGARIIVFEVGGVFDAGATDILMVGESDSNVTVACQTAPHPGVVIKGLGLRIKNGAHNIIMRHCKIRNIDPGNALAESSRAIGIIGTSGSVRDMIFDHMSLSWATDENFTVYMGPSATEDSGNITLSNSIIAEGDADSHHSESGQLPVRYLHAMGPGCASTSGTYRVEGCSILSNLIAHNARRNPLIAAAKAEIQENIIYNWHENGVSQLG